MTLRPATSADMPAILELFELALGTEGGLPTREFWEWKHQQNPFGESPGLLAFDGDRLIAIRVFMQWQFLYKGQTMQAVRAVDTATHPDYRGQGWFRKLTLELLEQLPEDVQLVFNTPNAQSRPGYLKMGWQELGKPALWMCPVFPVFVPKHPNWDIQSTLSEWDIMEYLSQYRENNTHRIITAVSPDYIYWRYVQVPGYTYHHRKVVRNKTVAWFIYRTKETRGRKEMRICEAFGQGAGWEHLFRKAAMYEARQHEAQIISWMDAQQHLWQGWIPARRFNLSMTYRAIPNRPLPAGLPILSNWNVSAGSLELF